MGILSVSASGADDFGAANEKFAAGDYAGAADAYEKILQSEGPSVAVLYNLGNSYQRLEKSGLAILAYERARLFAPRDADVAANLAMVRKGAAGGDAASQLSWFHQFLLYFSRHEWACVIAGAALLLGALALFAGSRSLKGRGGRQVCVAMASVAGLVLSLGVVALHARRVEADLGIVLSPDAALRLSPFDRAEAIGSPGAGRRVVIGQQSGDYRFVEVEGAPMRGWLAVADLAPILPEVK